jgi:divalent metal cation (Fe/Co/Zn/Cd) transporter
MGQAAASAALPRAIRLEWITIAWNVVEVGITIGLGVAAGSLALIAFGLDSMVEVFASLVVVWHLRGDRASHRRHRRGLTLVGLAFILLAVILLGGGLVRLASGAMPEESPLGIAYLAVTAVVMFTLARLKAADGRALANGPLASEARVTFLDGLLACGILVALVLNAVAGWWWADAIAAIAVGVLAAMEGRENLESARAAPTADQVL